MCKMDNNMKDDKEEIPAYFVSLLPQYIHPFPLQYLVASHPSPMTRAGHLMEHLYHAKEEAAAQHQLDNN